MDSLEWINSLVWLLGQSFPWVENQDTFHGVGKHFACQDFLQVIIFRHTNRVLFVSWNKNIPCQNSSISFHWPVTTSIQFEFDKTIAFVNAFSQCDQYSLQMLQMGYMSDMQHLKKYFYKEKQWKRRGNRAETEMGTLLSAKNCK